MTGSLHVDTALALRDGLLAGVGLSTFPLFYLEDELKRGELTQVLTGWKLEESGFFALFPPRSTSRPEPEPLLMRLRAR